DVQSAGARFFVVPSTAFWWLDHYTDFGLHLEMAHRIRWLDEDCVIFELRGKRPHGSLASRWAATLFGTGRDGPDSGSNVRPLFQGFDSPTRSETEANVRLVRLIHAVRQEADAVLSRKGTVLVVNGGDGRLLNLNGRPARPFPGTSGPAAEP